MAVSWRGPEHKEATNWTDRVLELLCDALCDWGVGGKTTSGYGHFDREKLDASRKVEEEKKAILLRDEEVQNKLAAMSPIERSIGKSFSIRIPTSRLKST